MMNGRCSCDGRRWANNAVGVKCPFCGAVIHEDI